MPASNVSLLAQLKRSLLLSATILMGGSFLSATLALLEEIADLGQQLFLPGQFRRRRRSLFLALELVHGADHDEQHEGDNQEVNGQGEETAPGQHGALLFGIREVAGGDLA